MAFLEYSQQLDTGVDAMNGEHRTLINLMNNLHSLNEAGARKAELEAALHDLGAYTQEHFQREEEFMESIKFPKIDTHKLIHKDLLDKFSIHVAEFQSSGELTPAFFAFLKLWLNSHIQGIDVQYGQFLNKKAA